jgi:hypothetical protein
MTSINTNKFKSANIFDCSNIGNLIDVIVMPLSYGGSTKSHFYLCEYEGLRFLTKIGFHDKNYVDLYVKNRKSTGNVFTVEMHILDTLKTQFIYKNITPHIIEMVFVCECKVSDLNSSKICDELVDVHARDIIDINVHSIICNHKGLVARGLAYDKCTISVMEHGNVTLSKFINVPVTPIQFAIIKGIIFKLLYTLHAIGRQYPKFRHYDLHSENVVILFDGEYNYDVAIYDRYVIEGLGCANANAKANANANAKADANSTVFCLPYFGLIPKIIDFGNSIMPEIGAVSTSYDDVFYMNNRVENDILFIFHWFHVITVDFHKSTAVDRLLSALDPTRSYINYNTDRIRELGDKIPTYSMMLECDVWDSYKNIQNSNIRKEYITPL